MTEPVCCMLDQISIIGYVFDQDMATKLYDNLMDLNQDSSFFMFITPEHIAHALLVQQNGSSKYVLPNNPYLIIHPTH